MSETIERIGVVGGGLMGAGIAEVAARTGHDVVVRERDAETAGVALAKIEASLARGVRAGKLDDDEAARAAALITVTEDWDALADRQLVVEAVPEDERAKLEAFTTLDTVVRDSDAVLASNTSSIPIMKLAMATSRPETVIGLHFFNPVPVLHLVEVVPSLLTAPRTIDAAESFASDGLQKRLIRSQDRAGFVVNALLIPYLLSAMRMLESGFATAPDIDTGMVEGCAHPLGPLALSDLVGLDTVCAVAESLYAEFKEPLFAPPPILLRMVEAGLLGRKTGRGFYDHHAR